MKLYILSEQLTYLANKWICDVFEDEFTKYVNDYTDRIDIVKTPEESDVIWLIAPWYYKKINAKILDQKFVISTIHHIDRDKYDENKNMYDNINKFTNIYHVICSKVEKDLSEITDKKIIVANFWINENVFGHINTSRKQLRKKYNIPSDKFIIGSFQRDTEGKDKYMPKLSKGPDIFIKIVSDMKNKGLNPFIVLSGWRRTFIMNELERYNIPYTYMELVDQVTLNELYNCLDMYIVSSRVEGGPRSLMECGLTKTPIISTNVGISELILNNKSIYDMDNYITYQNATPNVTYAYDQSMKYTLNNYMKIFINTVFEDCIII